MKPIIHILMCFSALVVSSNSAIIDQSVSSTEASESRPINLFDAHDILNISLKGDMKELLKDKSDDPQYYPLEFSYIGDNNKVVSMPVGVKTRGNFRRLLGRCKFLPLMLKFDSTEVKDNSIFKEQKKMKLVMPCKDEKYVVREWLVYKLYNLITPYSFKTRLVRIRLEDTKNNELEEGKLGILLEEEDQMAARNEMIAVEHSLSPNRVPKDVFVPMAIFQYMIGNCDWSVKYRQNIKLIASNATSLPSSVPYDFDHAGIVDAPYAKPPEGLKLKSTQQRRYRGYCMEDLSYYEKSISLYNSKKEALYDVYRNCDLIEEKYKKNTLEFLDKFYETLNNPKEWQKDFAYPCDPRGTGNIVIKGLQKN